MDIVEVGNAFYDGVRHGAGAQNKGTVPGLEVLCDTKIMDAGAYEARLAFEDGADYVTVLGCDR